ncbi:MAG: O-acetylhomoserine aminocarboxypropyltransferase/cysteine synthase, partial [Actinobacteria bacterium]|nr:O-acetylhomoserine aminocarboxypropyltransferase/cysteine synthase [Actinomycetota bacterium]
PDANTGSRTVPIYQSTAFVFEDTKDAGDLFALRKYGNIYSRIANPTVAALEEKVAALEGGLGAVATSSGLSAQFLVFACLTQSGDHIVASSNLYGGTITQLDVTMKKFGVETTFVTSDDPKDYEKAIKPNTKLILTEVVSNPSNKVADLESLAKIAHSHDIPLVVDSTLTTPYLVGGVVVESGKFNWGNGKFPSMLEKVPHYGDITWWGNFGEYGFLTKLRAEQLRDIGSSLTPLAAFLLIQGIETLAQRMQDHVFNAQKVAEFLANDNRVSWVNYAGLKNHPQHDLVKKYLPKGAGAVFSFGVKGGRQTAEKFINSVELLSHLANVGDARSLVIHPASTTHRQLTDAQLEAAGVKPDLVRISVGIEDVEDIIWDIDQALTKAMRNE